MVVDDVAGSKPVLERFDAYVERCLYHPEAGFYTSGAGSAGRHRGDFITSPETGPLFAEVMARWLDDCWDRLGRPDPFTVYDAGTGPGTLTRALDSAGGRSAPVRQVEGFDRPASQGATTGAPPSNLGGAVVIANELLDNLPFRVVEHQVSGWAELYVATGADVTDAAGADSPAEELVPIDSPGLDVPVGRRAPLLEQAHRWVSDVLAAGPAALLVLDYGTLTTAELAERRGWLRTYRRHERGHDPLHEPGFWDITTDIAVDQLPPPDEVMTQAAFLRRWGIDELVAEGRAYWQAHAAAPDLTALKMRSRHSEADALLDPSGLGSWLACTWAPSPSVMA